jgi:Ca2+-binding EF-hand superfamily protein
MNVNKQLKLAGFFLTLSEWDRHVEVIRQILNGLDQFEPYAAFLRITKGKSNSITSRNLCDFMRENGLYADDKLLCMIIRLYDTHFDNSLNFEDFLKMILTRDNPQIRFQAAQRPNYDVVGYDNVLSEEIEYTLARFFKKASEFLHKMILDVETQRLIGDTSIFNEIDTKRTKQMDFTNLKAFFESSKIIPRDSEIIAILRVIDINDDGIITEAEFNYFIELFSSREPTSITLNKLKDIKIKETRTNYFGERHSEIAEGDKRGTRVTTYTPTRTEKSRNLTPTVGEEERKTTSEFSRTEQFHSKKLNETSHYTTKERHSGLPEGRFNQTVEIHEIREKKPEPYKRTEVVTREVRRSPEKNFESKRIYSRNTTNVTTTSTRNVNGPVEEVRKETTIVRDRKPTPTYTYEEKRERTRSPNRDEEVITRKTITSNA